MDQAVEKILLVVDEEMSSLKALARLGRQAGMRVYGFETPAALPAWWRENAEKCISQRAPVCLVLDMKSQAAVLASLPAELARISPIVCIGRDAAALSSHQRLSADVFAYLEKPFSLQAMAEVLVAAFHEQARQLGAQRAEDSVRQGFARLTRRETEVCGLVVQGLQNKVISDVLGITLKTVKAHRAKVMAKTGVRSLADLIRAHDIWLRAGEGK